MLRSAQPRGSLLRVDADALASYAALGIVVGVVYDALLAHCAIKAKADELFTWNARHCALCGPEVLGRLRAP